VLYNIGNERVDTEDVMNKRNFHAENKMTAVIKVSKKKRGDIIAKSDDSFGAANYAEYSVARAKEGKYKTARLIAILVYALFPVLMISAAIAVNAIVKGIGFVLIMTAGALSPLIIWILVFFTWPFFSQSYHYEIEGASMTGTLHYGARYEKILFSVKIRDMKAIVPYSAHRTEADSYVSKGANVIMCASSMKAGDLYFARIEESDTVIFFEATEQSLRALKYYNSDAIEIVKTAR
jgi:hypothetical protein